MSGVTQLSRVSSENLCGGGDIAGKVCRNFHSLSFFLSHFLFHYNHFRSESKLPAERFRHQFFWTLIIFLGGGGGGGGA